jgi:hypothetical protein
MVDSHQDSSAVVRFAYSPEHIQPKSALIFLGQEFFNRQINTHEQPLYSKLACLLDIVGKYYNLTIVPASVSLSSFIPFECIRIARLMARSSNLAIVSHRLSLSTLVTVLLPSAELVISDELRLEPLLSTLRKKVLWLDDNSLDPSKDGLRQYNQYFSHHLWSSKEAVYQALAIAESLNTDGPVPQRYQTAHRYLISMLNRMTTLSVQSN